MKGSSRIVSTCTSLTLLVALVAVPLSAHRVSASATDGSIVGMVSDSNGPIQGACVTVTSISSTVPSYFSCTAPNGTYAVDGLPNGQYSLSFSGPYDAVPGYRSEYYNNKTTMSDADPVTVALGTTQTIDATLDRLGAITGTVTDAVSGSAVTAGTVYATADGGPFLAQTSSIAADGTYALSLPAGTYRVAANGGWGSAYATEYLGGVYTAAASTPVTVTLNTISAGNNFALDIGGTITGTVRGPDNTPLANACVYPQPTDNIYNSFGPPSDCTDTSGIYTITGISPGAYRLSFSGPYDAVPGYRSEYYNNKTTMSDADPVTVALGTTQTIDATLDRLGAITGTVTDAVSGSAVTAGTVYATADGGPFLSQTSSIAADGTYALSLPAGTYRVAANGGWGSAYATEYLGGVYTAVASTPVTVTLNTISAGNNFALDIGGTITGTVRGPDNTPLANACVYPQPTDNIYNSFGPPSDCTDTSGIYTITGISPGAYRLSFSGPYDAVPGYRSEYYNNKTTMSDADPVTVALGTTQTIDATLDRLGAITGTVTDAAGTALLSGTVYAIPDGGSYPTASAPITTGTYALSLPAGTYRVAANGGWGSAYATEYLGGVYTAAASTPVTVTLNTISAGNNFALDIGGTITGTVRGPDNTPLANACVYPQPTDNIYNSFGPPSDCTDTSGIYTITGISPGAYRLSFSGPYDAVPGYRSEYYNNKTTMSDADPVTVALGTTQTIDATLDRLAAITGKVTDAVSGSAVTAGTVYATADGGPFLSQTSSIAADGTYALSLPAGTYRVAAAGPSGSMYATQFLGGVYTAAASTPVTVTLNTISAGNNFALDIGGTITGTVRGPDNTPLANACVNAQTTDSFMSKSDCTDDSGIYTITGVAPVGYRLYFTGPSSAVPGYRSEYYDDTTTMSDADPVNVALGATLNNIDATLDRLGAITGTVTDAATGSTVTGGTVYAFNDTGLPLPWSAAIAPNGTYAISLPAGNYRIAANGGWGSAYAAEYLGGVYTAAASTPVTVTLNNLASGNDFALDIGGTITGTIRGPDNAPLANACVNAQTTGNYYLSASYDCTDTSGVYAIIGVTPVAHQIMFSGPTTTLGSGIGYRTEYYNNKTVASDADAVTVPLGATLSHIDATLDRLGVLSGTVRVASTGSALTGGTVYAYAENSTFLAQSSPIAADGNYSISLQPGDYRIAAAGPPGSVYAAEFLGGVYTPEESALLTVDVNTVRSGFDFALDIGGTITGTVRSPDNTPLANACVYAQTGDLSYLSPYDCTDTSGMYTITGVTPVAHQLFFSGPTTMFPVFGSGYMSEYFNNKTTKADADPVTVALGATLNNIDATLDYRSVITGSVSDDSGAPITSESVSIQAVNLATSQAYSGNLWGTSSYELQVPAGTYKIYALDEAGYYATEYYQNKTTFAAADSVVAVAGESQAIDFELKQRLASGPPTNVNGAVGNGQVTVSWTAPGDDGGSEPTGYMVTSDPEARTCTTAGATSCTVSGLTNGVGYTFTVTATNAIGTSAASDPSATYVPAGTPATPTGVNGAAGNGQVTVSWTAPSDNGRPITGYTVTSDPEARTCTTAGATSCTVSGLANGVGYTFTVTATNAIGTSAASDPSPFVTPAGAEFTALSPQRVFDTRPTEAQGVVPVAKHRYGGANILTIKVTDVAGVPATGVGAVSLNVTVVDPADAGYVTVYPCGERPLASNINYQAGQIAPNSVITPVSPSGEICLYSQADTHLLADINGWFATGAGFTALSPQRVFDTRPTEAQGVVPVAKHRYGGANILTIKVTDVAGVPATGVGAVSLNVTVVDPADAGYVTVYPCGERPLASNINYQAGQIAPNSVITPVSPSGEICLYSQADTHLLADINGWFATGAGFTALSPQRVFDTRPTEAQGVVPVAKHRYGGANILTIKVTDVAGVPATGVGAVSLNVTVVDPADAGYVTVYPCGERPLASNINYQAGQIAPNSVITPVSPSGEICLYSQADTHLLADINGWFATG